MKGDMIARICDCQAALIEALDDQDASAIETHTKFLSQLMEEFQSVSLAGSPARMAPDAEALDHAIRQTHAASIRVNHLAHWTRQRIDRLAQLRGIPKIQGYE